MFVNDQETSAIIFYSIYSTIFQRKIKYFRDRNDREIIEFKRYYQIHSHIIFDFL